MSMFAPGFTPAMLLGPGLRLTELTAAIAVGMQSRCDEGAGLHPIYRTGNHSAGLDN